jgi:hypothetical protein
VVDPLPADPRSVDGFAVIYRRRRSPETESPPHSSRTRWPDQRDHDSTPSARGVRQDDPRNRGGNPPSYRDSARDIPEPPTKMPPAERAPEPPQDRAEAGAPPRRRSHGGCTEPHLRERCCAGYCKSDGKCRVCGTRSRVKDATYCVVCDSPLGCKRCHRRRLGGPRPGDVIGRMVYRR